VTPAQGLEIEEAVEVSVQGQAAVAQGRDRKMQGLVPEGITGPDGRLLLEG
jgi:hypothetical protein